MENRIKECAIYVFSKPDVINQKIMKKYLDLRVVFVDFNTASKARGYSIESFA